MQDSAAMRLFVHFPLIFLTF